MDAGEEQEGKEVEALRRGKKVDHISLRRNKWREQGWEEMETLKKERLRKISSRCRKCSLRGLSPCSSQGYLGWATLLARDGPCLLGGDKSLSEPRGKETELCVKISNYKKLSS